MKKCKEGHYYCFQDSKCKPIPKGYRRGVGGYLRREREDEKEDSKKNGNGNGNGNNGSNGSNGNGSGNGNGVSGGNGGGNGSGGVGESFETIQNSEGETTAVVVDIIGPTHMRPRLNGNGVWKGTHITEAGRIAFGGYKDGIIINPSGSRNKYGLPDNLKPSSGSTKETPLTPTHNRLLVKNTKKKDVKESSVALPFFLKTINKTNALKKALPLLTTSVGALGTLNQIKNDQEPAKPRARYKRSKSKTKKRQLSDMEKKLTDRLNNQNLSGNRTGGETFDTKGLHKGSNILTPKKGEIMQDEYIMKKKSKD